MFFLLNKKMPVCDLSVASKFWASTEDVKPPCAPRFAEVRWSRCQHFFEKKAGKTQFGRFLFGVVYFWSVGFLLPKSSQKTQLKCMVYHLRSADKFPKSHPFLNRGGGTWFLRNRFLAKASKTNPPGQPWGRFFAGVELPLLSVMLG